MSGTLTGNLPSSELNDVQRFASEVRKAGGWVREKVVEGYVSVEASWTGSEIDGMAQEFATRHSGRVDVTIEL